MPMNQQNLSSFIWSVADLLRGDYKQSEYGRGSCRPETFLLEKSRQLFYNVAARHQILNVAEHSSPECTFFGNLRQALRRSQFRKQLLEWNFEECSNSFGRRMSGI